MSNGKNSLVSIATYNEIANLPRLVDQIQQYLPEADLLIVDDNSPDGTGRWCDERAKTDPRLHCLHRAGKLGLGTAMIAAMQYAVDHRYRYLVNLDADLSHSPKHLPEMLDSMESGEVPLDIMIGSRYVSGGKIEGWPLKRHLMSRAINLYSRWILWLAPHDCSGAYRCYRTSKLAKLDFSRVRSRGYSFEEEILWHLKQVGCRSAEIPITFVDRAHGSSKINFKEILVSLGILFQLGLRSFFGCGSDAKKPGPPGPVTRELASPGVRPGAR